MFAPPSVQIETPTPATAQKLHPTNIVRTFPPSRPFIGRQVYTLPPSDMPWTTLGAIPVWTPWGSNNPDQPVKADDAAHDRDLRILFTQALDNNEPPNVFKLSEISDSLSKQQLARLGYENPRDAIPALRVMAFEFRELGYCDVIYRGYIVPDDVGLEEIEGPIRVRRRLKHEKD